MYLATCSVIQILRRWARTHGMRFAPKKYTLTHLTRRRCFDLHAPVRLQGVIVEPEPVVQILGL